MKKSSIMHLDNKIIDKSFEFYRRINNKELTSYVDLIVIAVSQKLQRI